jgi:hypothetical protein
VKRVEKTKKNDEQREIVEWIDAKPKKRIITNKAMRCGFNQAMAEVVDNCLDYWEDLDKPHSLEIEIKVKGAQTDESTVTIEWNMAVPKERWRPLLTPGEVSHRSPKSIGAWGEGFKISVFATGRKIDIVTNVEGELFHIDIPDDFLVTDDWGIPVFAGALPGTDVPVNHTVVSLVGRKFSEHPTDLSRTIDYLSEVFGTRMQMEVKGGHGFHITVNGSEISPKTFIMPDDLAANFAFPPGFEPTVHRFEEKGLQVTMMVGLLSMADKELYGTYMYGNGRLFAKAVRDARLGYGVRSNSPIPMNHPLGMRLQIHVFFDGDSELIPWRAPLKDDVELDNDMIRSVNKWIRKYATPYAEFMKAAKASEFLPYSTRWNALEDVDKRKKILTKGERESLSEDEIQEGWETLPEEVRGLFDAPKRLQYWDHLESGRGRKPMDTPKFDRDQAKEVVKLIKGRDRGKVTTFELHNMLRNKQLGIDDSDIGPEERREFKMEEQLKQDDEPLFDPSEGSVTLSVRMDATDANELAKMTGVYRKSLLLNRVVDMYKSIQTLKGHEHLIDRKTEWSDEEFLSEVKSLLDAQLPQEDMSHRERRDRQDGSDEGKVYRQGVDGEKVKGRE